MGPAPNMRTEDPILGAILSRPWAAQEAGSRRVASTSERFLMRKTRPAGGQMLVSRDGEVGMLIEDGLTRISTILGKPTVQGDAMSFEMFTEQLLAATTVEAFAAELGVIGTDSLSDLKAFHVLSHGCDNTHGLVCCVEGEPGQKLALMDV